MRSSFAIFFLALYVLALVHPAVPFFEYELNKAYIAANLCENQDKPEMQCHGACHLKKQIKKQHEDQEGAGKVLIDMEKLPIAVIALQAVPSFYSTALPLSPGFTQELSANYLTEIFHPPIV